MRQLWAPWRIEFIRAVDKDDDCFLCRAARDEGEEKEIVLRRAEKSFCIMNRYPYSNGHLLIAPYRHVADLDDLTDAEMLEMMKLLRQAKTALGESVRPHGFNVGLNLGRAAGAGLEAHIHWHIVPRWVGDTNFMPVFGATKVIPQALHELAELLREGWPRNGAGGAS